MWPLRVGSFAVGLALVSVLACGGHSRSEVSGDPPLGSPGMDSAGTRSDTGVGGAMPAAGGVGGAMSTVGGSGGVGGGAAAAEADSTLSNSCPQTMSNPSCRTTLIDISFSHDGPSPHSGIWVEALQLPEYPPTDLRDLRYRPAIDPSKWDRSPLPAGACVLRIHRLAGDCLKFGPLYFDSCAALAAQDAEHAISFSFYESPSCREGIAPGCPSADPADWNNGNWWYLVGRGEDTDLVACAPQCSMAFTSHVQACLRMPGSD